MKKYFLFLFTVLALLSGCSAANDAQKDKENHEEHDSEHALHAPKGDIREETSNISTLPKFLDDKPEQMKVIYEAAAKNQELLEYIPCYCGCGDSVGHKDNYDCFVYENKPSEAIVWDDHGTKCGVCLETAAESILKYNEGASVEEIREYIDEKYKDGYAKPTPTKMPNQI
ncbi:PCYCGC domain-containing protein [Cytobacillus spongiae]|uniref:PCYCGC motif-containing (lipo)protein n=1 Tax=Cytobacillus spongiae TaxID=2901381 RepID=UPI001F3F5E04|nr:PCYCGC motif-containing (lipo)protein [Cytobacillus spongiae]UII54506.1 PCYCGC domain-containing protein [Cytobacillus spongiae]